MSEKTDILRRLRVIESILGVDLDAAKLCTGDPLNCSSDTCTVTVCPLRNNPLKSLLEEFGKVASSLALVRNFLEEVQRNGVVPTWVVEVAALKTEQEELQRRILATKEIVDTLGEGPLKDGLLAHLGAQETEMLNLERSIKDLRC